MTDTTYNAILPTQAEGELSANKSEDWFRIAFANAAVGMALMDPQGKFLQVNAAYCKITGYSEEELEHQNFFDLTHEDDRARNTEHFEQMLCGKSPGFILENRYDRKDGTSMWVQNSVSIVRDSRGNPLNIVALSEDITARKAAQSALAISEARARRFFDSNIVGVINWNLDTGIITDANDLFLKMVGYTRDDLRCERLNWKTMTPPEWEERNQEGVMVIRTSRSGTPYEKEYFRKDGSRVPIVIAGALFDDSPNEGLSLVLDISEQKRVESAIYLREARYRSLIMATTQVVWLADKSGAFVGGMDSWSEFTGQTREEYLGWGWLAAIHEEDREYVRELWAKSLASRQTFECEYRVRHRNGGFRFTAARATPVVDENGDVREWIGANTDITERLKHLREIEDLNGRLKRSIQETHHRVKNNLQIISALAELQIEDSQEYVPVTAISRIGQHTRNLAAIHDILTQQAKADGPTDFISARSVIDELIPLLQATSGGRKIHCQVAVIRLPVRAGTSLALLISEMVSNAVKHAKSDITLDLTVEGDEVRLEICDDGPGFPPDFDWKTSANTGLDLIASAANHDLRGEVIYGNRDQGGARVIVKFLLSALHTD